MAWRCASLMMPAATYSSSDMMRGGRLRMLKHGFGNDRRQIPMETKAVAGEFGIQDVAIRRGPDDLIHRIRDDADDLSRQFRCEGLPRPVGGLIEPIGIDFAVRITADLDHLGILQKGSDGRPHRGLQHAQDPRRGCPSRTAPLELLGSCHLHCHPHSPVGLRASPEQTTCL